MSQGEHLNQCGRAALHPRRYGFTKLLTETVIGQLRRSVTSSRHDTSTAGSQHIVAQVSFVRRDDREVIFAACGEKIHRPADVRGNLRPAHGIERHHQLDRNTRLAQFRRHLGSGTATERVADDHDRTKPASLVLLDRLLRERRPVVMISDRRRNAMPCHPAGEFAEPRRIIAQTEQHIKVRPSPGL
jgi:hypothetical protein